MYSFDILPEAREQADALPAEALPCYAELLVFLELTPGLAPLTRMMSRSGPCGRSRLDLPARA